jgi:SAM-dependent methyltransferase
MTATAFSDAEVTVIWHDAECGAYGADLPLWQELAAAAGTGAGGADVLDLGAGTGRVALHLAERGHRVRALDADPVMTATLRERGEGTGVEVLEADARDFDLGERFDLVVAPMQLAHLLDASGRASLFRCVAAHLRPDGLAAIALMTRTPEPWSAASPDEAPLPDVRERGAWVFSSHPIAIERDGERVVIRRLRQIVSPSGELTEERHTFTLARLSADRLEAEAGAAGLVPAGRRDVGETDDHVGSTVVLLEPGR